jgi:hypothetical protein
MQIIYGEITNNPIKDGVSDPVPMLLPFISMVHLQREIDEFFSEYDLPKDLLLAANWESFQSLLKSILADQPINNPCNGIKQFAFKPPTDVGVAVEIEYEKAPAVYDTLRL